MVISAPLPRLSEDTSMINDSLWLIYWCFKCQSPASLKIQARLSFDQINDTMGVSSAIPQPLSKNMARLFVGRLTCVALDVWVLSADIVPSRQNKAEFPSQIRYGGINYEYSQPRLPLRGVNSSDVICVVIRLWAATDDQIFQAEIGNYSDCAPASSQHVSKQHVLEQLVYHSNSSPSFQADGPWLANTGKPHSLLCHRHSAGFLS